MIAQSAARKTADVNLIATSVAMVMPIGAQEAASRYDDISPSSWRRTSSAAISNVRTSDTPKGEAYIVLSVIRKTGAKPLRASSGDIRVVRKARNQLRH
jgi:hypothetical protein